MKIKIIILAILLLFVVEIKYSYANFAIKEWHQENEFNEFGQTVSVKLLMKVHGLKKGYYHDNWVYTFPKDKVINFISGDVLNSNDSNVNFNKEKNAFEFHFKKAFNGDEIFLDFKYSLKNNEKYKYTKDEYVYIPAFAVGANATISVNFSKLKNSLLFSNNEKFECIEKICTWTGRVENDGFLDVFELTKNSAKWLITTTLNMSNNGPIDNLNVKLPLYYVGGGNNVLNLKISNNQNGNIDYKNIKYDNNHIYVNFIDYDGNDAFINVEGIVENSYNTKKYWLKELDQNKLVEIDSETSLLLNNAINIIMNNNVNNEPIHVAIAKWVYNNIIYDEELSETNLTTKEVFLRKKGVCKHIASLYADMLRSINIPAIAVNGLAFDKKTNSFDYHSWTLVYYNGEWIPIDPTWNLYSGKLPISHIFIYKDVNATVSFSSENFDNFRTSISTNVEFIE